MSLSLLFSVPVLLALAFMCGGAYHAYRKHWRATAVWGIMAVGMIGLEAFLINSWGNAIRSAHEQAQNRQAMDVLGAKASSLVARRMHEETERTLRAKRLGRTENQFRFLKGGMTLSEIIKKVGKPDREYNGGQLYWYYDLADGSEMVICPNVRTYGDWSTSHVAWYGQQRGTNWLWTKPQDYK